MHPARRDHRPLRDTLAQLNPVLRGWGAYLRTGNAAIKFGQVDDYVAWRLKRLLVKRHGRNLRPGQAAQWTPAFFHALVSTACTERFATRRLQMPHSECSLLSRVREIRTHGLNGVVLTALRSCEAASRICQWPTRRGDVLKLEPYGNIVAISVSSIAFGLAHPQSSPRFICVTIVGAYLGWWLLRSRHIGQ